MLDKKLFIWLLVFSLVVFAQANELKIVEDNGQSLVCEWKAAGYEVVPCGDYSLVRFAKVTGHNTQYGKAMMPVASFVFQVPGNISGIQIIASEKKSWQLPQQLFPLQHPYADLIGAKDPEFVKDASFYASKQLFPAQIVGVSGNGIMRGRKLATLSITPLQYLPAENMVTAYTRIQFRVDYDLQKGRAPQTYDDQMDPIACDVLVNFTSGQSRKSRGVELLILTPDALKTEADRFAEWKSEQGYSTEVVSFASPTVEQAQSTISNYYNSQQTAYFVIFGDSEVFPLPMSSYNHPYHGTPFPTDVIYACVDGDDYYPDMYHGRIPAKNLEEAKTMVDKIIDYQQNPEPGDWYDRCCLCGEYQNSSYAKTEAQRLFCETAYVIYANLKDRYVFPQDPTIGVSYPPSAGDVYRFHSGASLAYRTLKGQALVPDWQAKLTTSSVAGANTKAFWNQGAFLVQHRDHGGYDGWGKPSFQVSDVAGLTNGKKLPVLLSINCLTGGIDYSGGDCFAEAAIKNPNGGAVAVFAATRVSYSGWNDNLCDGFYVCFNANYNTYASATPNMENPHPRSLKLGIILNYGKYYMMKNKGTGTQCQLSFDLFQCYGDPTMSMRTERPAEIQINYPTKVAKNGLFDIQVTGVNKRAIPKATVCLYDHKTRQQFKGYTDENGQLSLNLSQARPGTFILTVTGDNLRPYQTIIEHK